MFLLLSLMVSLMSLLHLHRHTCRAAAGHRPRCTRLILTRSQVDSDVDATWLAQLCFHAKY